MSDLAPSLVLQTWCSIFVRELTLSTNVYGVTSQNAEMGKDHEKYCLTCERLFNVFAIKG